MKPTLNKQPGLAHPRWRTLQKLAELALTHLATFAFPLVFAVVCGRTLGLYDYGVVSIYTSLCGFLGVVVEFGFDWHGIREVSPARHKPAHCHRVVWNITAARLLVCSAVVVVVGAVLLLRRPWTEVPLMLASAAFMVGFALDTSWYLRAQERIRTLLAITVSIRLAGIGLLLWLVQEPGDLLGAVWCYAIISLSTSGLSWLVLWRQRLTSRQDTDLRYIVQLMRQAWVILLGNLNGALLTNGGVALLGLIGTPEAVGAANLALRVKMAGQALLLPLNQLAYVRITALAPQSPHAAVALARKALIALMGVAVAAAVGLLFAAGPISTAVFKAPTPLAESLILLAALSIPMNAASNLFGMQSLIAFGAERAYALALMCASVVFAALLILQGGGLAYGWALVAAEACTLVLTALCLRHVVAQRFLRMA